MGFENDSHLSQRLAPLCASAGTECNHERVRCNTFETDSHCNDGALDIAYHLHGRSAGGAPADAAATGSHYPSCGYVPLYPHPAH